MTADEVRQLRRDELLIVSGNRQPVWTGCWFWDRLRVLDSIQRPY